MCFWWPSMEKEVNEYVVACPVCLQNKSSCRLPVPCHPWSDILLDYLNSLQAFEGNTTVLTVVERSKMIHFIPLPRLGCHMYSTCTDIPGMWCRTGSVCLSHGSGRSSCATLGPQSVLPSNTIPNSIKRQRDLSLRSATTTLFLAFPPPGVNIKYGLNMHRTPCLIWLLVSPHSSVLTDTNLPLFPEVEAKGGVPSAQAIIHHACSQTSQKLKTATQNKGLAGCR